MKKTLTLLFLFGMITGYSQQIKWIPFRWHGDSVSGKYFDKLAIDIPLTIDSLPHRFTMQLDLGAVTTVFYGNNIDVYLKKYNSLNKKLDTASKFWMEGKQNPMFKNVNLRLGNVAFRQVSVGYYEGHGEKISEEALNHKGEVGIGTIAPDLFQDKILIIDYKAARLAVVDNLPKKYKNVPFEKFELKDGRIKIPFQINGKTEFLLFDTGSSIFTLATTKENALAIGESHITDSLKVNSWGNTLVMNGHKTVVPIRFGKKELKNSLVYYDEARTFEEFYKSENIWGLTGNAYFFDNVVVIDYKNKLFGVK